MEQDSTVGFDGAAVPVEQPDPLQYAPTARGTGPGRPLAMLSCGLLTSAVALLGVYLVARFEHGGPFGWHALLLLPVGSPLLAAASFGRPMWATEPLEMTPPLVAPYGPRHHVGRRSA